MTLIEVMKEAENSKHGDLLIRRECWRPSTSGLEVGEESFWDLVHGKATPYTMCPDEIKATDWVVEGEAL